MAVQSNFPTLRPTLNLDFANSQSVDPRITFARASAATYIDSLGVMRTAPAGVPRIDFNPVTGECLGLLIEEQRTNLLLNSDALSTQSVTVAATAHTLSFYGTGQVTLSGAHSATLVGSGVFPSRATLTFTPSAGTLTLTVSGSVTLAQLEAGAFPTSYIKTEASQVTRNADAASMTGANFSSWYRQDEGTLYAEVASSQGSIPFAYAIDSGLITSEIRLASNSSGAMPAFVVTTDSTQQVNIPVSSGAYLPYKSAAAYRVNDFQHSVNGGLGTADTLGSVPVVNTMRIGLRASNLQHLNGHLRRLAYYPKRLTNAQLQSLTT